MIILKSFYRKKNTKIYLVIITLLFLSIGILLYLRQSNYNRANNNLEPSYISFNANKEALEFIQKINDIKELKYGIEAYYYNKAHDDTRSIYLFSNNEVENNYTYISQYLTTDFSSIASITLNGNKYHFKVNKIINENIDFEYMYISSTDFNTISSKSSNYTFFIYPSKWLEKDKIINRLKTFGILKENIEEYEKTRLVSNSFLTKYYLISIVLIIIGIIFLIVLFITIKNILIDENKNTKLLRCLGFRNSTIKKYHILKIISLLALSIVISTLIISLVIILF